MSNSSIRPIDRTLLGASTLGLSGLGSNENEGVLRILQTSCITRASPLYCLVSLTGHSLGGGLNPLQRCSRCILQPQQTGLSLFIMQQKLTLSFVLLKAQLRILFWNHKLTDFQSKVSLSIYIYSNWFRDPLVNHYIHISPFSGDIE